MLHNNFPKTLYHAFIGNIQVFSLENILKDRFKTKQNKKDLFLLLLNSISRVSENSENIQQNYF